LIELTPQEEERAKELLETFELSDAANRKVKTYSGGMRRRLDLAATLVASPSILFLDEPTTGLDPRSRLGLWEVIASQAKDCNTVFLTTQYLEEADRLANKIAIVDKGQILREAFRREMLRFAGQERQESTTGWVGTAHPAREVRGDPSTTQSGLEMRGVEGRRAQKHQRQHPGGHSHGSGGGRYRGCAGGGQGWWLREYE